MNPGFSCDFLKVKSADGLNFVLLEGFTFTALDNGEVITVPEGSTTDGASVPQEFWDIMPPFGDWWMPAVAHDAMYREFATSSLHDGPISKERADQILDQGMKVKGVHLLKRAVIFEAVLFKGAAAYSEDQTQAHARLLAAATAARASLSAPSGSTVMVTVETPSTPAAP